MEYFCFFINNFWNKKNVKFEWREHCLSIVGILGETLGFDCILYHHACGVSLNFLLVECHHLNLFEWQFSSWERLIYKKSLKGKILLIGCSKVHTYSWRHSCQIGIPIVYHFSICLNCVSYRMVSSIIRYLTALEYW